MKKIVAGTCTLAMTLSMTSIALADTKTTSVGGNQTLTTDVQDVLSMNCVDVSNEVANDHVVELGNLTPGTPVTGATVCTVLTNSDNGYTLAVKRDDATTTMDKDSNNGVDISDLTETVAAPLAAWVNGTTQGLGYTVNSMPATGTSNIDGAAYAGFGAANANFMTATGYSSTATSTEIGYKLDVPSTQQSGTYTGTITYTVTTSA